MIRPLVRFNLKKTLLFSFVALGPIGNILTPHFFPASFRAYYFLLPLFPLFFFSVQERLFKIGAIFFPFLIYCYLSATFVENFGTANEPHTVFRFFLLFCQFFFAIGAASSLRKKEEVSQIIRIYLTSFFVSIFIGYVFFIGYYLKIVPISIINRFSVLTQFGFGILRFAPGSYPNEYGIVSSFALSVLVLILLGKKNSLIHFSKKWFWCLFLSTFLAFLLTTTRAAYLSFAVSVLYLTWKSGHFIKTLLRLSVFIVIFFATLMAFKFNMFRILSAGFTQKINEGSLGERYFLWLDTVDQAKKHPFLGTGFASLTNMHNVYLQLLFELGCVGTALFLCSLCLSFIESFSRYKRPLQDEASIFFGKIRMVGLINALSFAASNHNLNHHLTWFIFFFCLASLRLPHLKTIKNF